MTPTSGDQVTIADLLQSREATSSPAQGAGLAQLQDVLRLQGQQYGNLLALLQSFNTSASVQDTHSQAVLNSIQHQLGNLAATQQQLTQLQSQLGPAATRTSPELQEELKRQELLLKHCLEQIGRLETDFTDRRRRLKPELDETARRRSMRSAYQQSLKTG